MADRGASIPEFMPLLMPEGHYDVAVLGGGLAGLSIGLQLVRERPGTRVLVAEKRADPPREAAFKVGESTVENGAHYYREVIGMRDHLEERQIRKLGLRFFLPAGDKSDITKRIEFCTPGHLNAFTHQIDRGRFENELFDRNLRLGVDAVRGFRVLDVDFGEPHKVKLGYDGGEVEITARWVVDAAGRANIVRNKLGLQDETGHHINASWLRLQGGLDFEEWGADDEEWLSRMPERGLRLYSTTHLIDAGYWLWLIQLASGPISIGVCADPRFHPFEEINTLDGFIDWMKREEPQLGREIDARRADIMDFLRVEDFSYASTRVISSDRWALVGEAGGFIDAFYSPGSDFIAYTNTFSTECIKADLDGTADLEETADFYNDFFFRLFNPTISLYRDQYQLFKNPQIMVAKIVYDSMNYFTCLGSPFVHGQMRTREQIERLTPVVEEVIPLIPVVQEFFREWHSKFQLEYQGVSVLSKDFESYIHVQEELGHPAEGEELLERTKKNTKVVKAYITWLLFKACRTCGIATPDETRPLNLERISLDPSRWESELYADEGMSYQQALAALPGVEEMDLEARGAVLPEDAVVAE
ncbi:MAG TPA: NAD(P)/FAD-dependent oxidoreductase [Thermoleophilaceae bacterium]|nr:NAD(P)/FAD-dependent oxidoreductase [Thermoleophilaceae bacterium]